MRNMWNCGDITDDKCSGGRGIAEINISRDRKGISGSIAGQRVSRDVDNRAMNNNVTVGHTGSSGLGEGYESWLHAEVGHEQDIDFAYLCIEYMTSFSCITEKSVDTC